MRTEITNFPNSPPAPLFFYQREEARWRAVLPPVYEQLPKNKTFFIAYISEFLIH
jgi:hypothetical protein